MASEIRSDIDDEIYKAVNIILQEHRKVLQSEKKNINKGGPYPNHEQWEQSLQYFKDFIKKYGRMPQLHGKIIGEQTLYNWRNTQIATWKKKTILPYRKQKLEEIPEWTWPTTTKKRKFSEIEDDDFPQEEEVVQPKQKRQRPEITWIGEMERTKYVEKISVLETQLVEKDTEIKKQLEIMEHQYNFITVINKKIADLEEQNSSLQKVIVGKFKSTE